MGTLKTLVGISSFVFFMHSQARSEVFFVPGDCQPSEASLLVYNKTTTAQAFWIQLHSSTLDESRYELAPQEKILIKARDFLNTPQAFSIRTWEDKKLTLVWQCGSTQTPLSTLTTPLVEHFVPLHTSLAQLKIINLTPFTNTLEIQFLNSTEQVLSTQKIQLEKYYETQISSLPLPAMTTHIRIQGQGRLHSWLVYSADKGDGEKKLSPGYSLQPQSLNPDPNKKYFLVSTKKDSAESYVVASDNAEIITQAREQISNPRLEKIVVARISMGHGGYNRSFTGRERSPYSWAVSEIDAFADFAYIDCDGSPDIVEENLMTRINEGGRICFWRYRIIRELSLDEVQHGH